MQNSDTGTQEGPLEANYRGSFAIRLGDEVFDYSPVHGRGGVITRVCRELIRRGYDPERTIRVSRNGVRVFRRDETLGRWAGLTVREGEQSAKLVPYREGPASRA